MLWLDVNIVKDLQFDAEFTLHNIENLLCVLLLGLGEANLV